MDELEQYLNEVCRGLGGARAMREHVRQELREHLLDAAAQHRAAGLPDTEALQRALSEFGRPDEVRSDLEATHGQRSLLAVLIDKAVQWKEMTMKAKWLWTSWAYLGLILVIVLEALFLVGIVMFIVPKFERLMLSGLIDPWILDESGVSWMPLFLHDLSRVAEKAPLWLVLAAGAWALFEWRVRSENKTFMRLAALGTAALALMVVIFLAGASLLICFSLGAPASGRMARTFGQDQVAKIDAALSAIEQALPRKEWGAMKEEADRAMNALEQLMRMAPALPSLTRPGRPLAELQASASAARLALADVQQAVAARDATRLERTLEAFRAAFAPLREAAKGAAP